MLYKTTESVGLNKQTYKFYLFNFNIFIDFGIE